MSFEITEEEIRQAKAPPIARRELSIEDIQLGKGPLRETGTYLVEFTPLALAALMDTASWPAQLRLRFRAFDSFEGTIEMLVEQWDGHGDVAHQPLANDAGPYRGPGHP